VIKYIFETTKHKLWVFVYLFNFSLQLIYRGIIHDNSKFSKEEMPYFLKVLPRLKYSAYGSQEYKDTLKEIKPAIDNHNKINKHHPEHYKNGISDFSLLDLIEMLYDWKAAVKRHKDGNILDSIKINSTRFNYSNVYIENILRNTIK